MTNEERIKADAEATTRAEEKRLKDNNHPDYGRMVSQLHGYHSGYIAGATAENDRAQVLVDALEWIKNYGNDLTVKFIDKLLEQWKSGKGKETKVYRPCPHCGKELFRDRNLCCRSCGKEVGDE